MVSSGWLLLGIGGICASALMMAMSSVALRIGAASHVDVAWAYGIGGLAVLDPLLADGADRLALPA